MNLGIIQGRLSIPDLGFQDCPRDWKKEFLNLEKLGLKHIEWIVTKKSFDENPVFFHDLKNFPISSVCVDHLVDQKIDDFDFIDHYLGPVCHAVKSSKISRITIPLLEESSVEEDDKRFKFISNFSKFISKHPDINFSFETELALNKICDLLVHPNITLTYDVGNTTAYGLSHRDYIGMFFKKISNVHLKDRKIGGKSVYPGTGDTDFQMIFRLLRSFGYDKDYTMQFCRGIDGQETETCKDHIDFIKSLYVNTEKI